MVESMELVLENGFRKQVPKRVPSLGYWIAVVEPGVVILPESLSR